MLSSGCNVEEFGRQMEPGNSFIPASHRYSFAETKRYNSCKAADLDNGDFLAIDDLLDFSNEDIGGPIELVHRNEGSSSTPSEAKVGCNSSVDSKQSLNIFGADAAGELCVPCDDLAELEWLSNFVEESFSSGDASANIFSSGVHAAGLDEKKKGCRGDSTHFQSTSPVSVLESDAYSEKLGTSFNPEMSVPGRARSKRCRTAVCFWNTRILSGDASASILETSSTSTVTGGDPQSSDSDFAYEHRGADSSPGKKHCNSNNASKGKKGQDAAQARTCLHCGTQRTPQWRAGPAGPKTLCNACGVRYKSGRLFPEYRPAASPTFTESIHSNSHRKVLEMRKQRDGSHESSCNSDNGDDE